MKRVYRLACNYNVLEISPEPEDLLEFADYAETAVDDDGNKYPIISEDELLKRLLQHEYDILATIEQKNTVGVTQQRRPAAPARGRGGKGKPTGNPNLERPSDAMIEWAENLGMDDAASQSKREVWEYINKYK